MKIIIHIFLFLFLSTISYAQVPESDWQRKNDTIICEIYNDSDHDIIYIDYSRTNWIYNWNRSIDSLDDDCLRYIQPEYQGISYSEKSLEQTFLPDSLREWNYLFKYKGKNYLSTVYYAMSYNLVFCDSLYIVFGMEPQVTQFKKCERIDPNTYEFHCISRVDGSIYVERLEVIDPEIGIARFYILDGDTNKRGSTLVARNKKKYFPVVVQDCEPLSFTTPFTKDGSIGISLDSLNVDSTDIEVFRIPNKQKTNK
jgi:hypothetical protein